MVSICWGKLENGRICPPLPTLPKFLDEIISNFEHFDILIGQEVFWETNQGVAQSIAEDGSLVVETSNKILNLHAEEVHLEKKCD